MMREFYGENAVPYTQNGNAPNMETDAHGTYYYNTEGDKVYISGPNSTTPNANDMTSSPSGGSNPSGGGSNPIGGGGNSSGGGGGNTTTSSSPQEQIMNQRTDQAKAMKAEELYNNGQISYAEYEDILNRMS